MNIVLPVRTGSTFLMLDLYPQVRISCQGIRRRQIQGTLGAEPLKAHTAGTYIALCDIRTCYGIPALAGPVRMEELAAGLVGALVGVGAEVVALSLQQIGGQA